MSNMDTHGFTPTPLRMDIMQRFTPDQVTASCWRLLPERKFYSSSLLVEALVAAFETPNDVLQLKVRDLVQATHTYPATVVDTWLELYAIS